MSKVVLLAVNAKYVHSSLSVWALAAGISEYAGMRHEVIVLEKTINHITCEIADEVSAYKPDVVGISTYIWNAGMLPELLGLLRDSLPNALIVLGGPEASHNAGFWLSLGADYVLHGEGEASFPALLDEKQGATKQGETKQGDGSSAWKNQADEPSPCLVYQADEPSPCYPCYPDPYSDAYFAALGGRMAYIETSRGCPFSCAFCLSAGSGVRYLPLDVSKVRLEKLSKSGAKTVKLVDRTFNCDAGRAYELFEFIIGLDTKCCFHFEVAADLFDKRTLDLLACAPPGRIQFEAGLQSYFEPALKAASRKTDLEKTEENIRELLRGRNIHVHVDLIAGLPYETLSDFESGFDRAYSLKVHTLQLGFLKLLHGSKLREQAETLGISYAQEPPYEIQESRWLSAPDLQILKKAENALRNTYNKSRFLSAIEYVLSVSGLRPFSFFRELGEAVSHHETRLDGYARQIYDFCVVLPCVDEKELQDRMISDWLGMVKGNNMPAFLRKADSRQIRVLETAKSRLRHELRRCEAAILSSGKGVFVDSECRDPVTGLYAVHYIK